MKIKVDFYTETGKWYSGGEVEIGEVQFHNRTAFMQAIVNNQELLVDQWVDDRFFVITEDTYENQNDPEFHGFNQRLFMPADFAGMRRS